MLVAHILKSKGHRVVTVPPEATIAAVARTLKDERIGAVVVTGKDGAVAGIISERDIVRAMPEHGAALLEQHVGDLMTRKVVTCTPEDNLDDIRREMTAGRFRHIPVVVDEALVGIISIGDVVKARLDELETETNQLRDYIAGA